MTWGYHKNYIPYDKLLPIFYEFGDDLAYTKSATINY